LKRNSFIAILKIKEGEKMINQHGIEFSVEVIISAPAMSGGAITVCSFEEYEKHKSDPLQIVARHHGVALQEYLRWIEADGAVRCIAKTGSGRQCKCRAVGLFNLEAVEWVKAQSHGGYCRRHGG
jgi:hypothetical protein